MLGFRSEERGTFEGAQVGEAYSVPPQMPIRSSPLVSFSTPLNAPKGLVNKKILTIAPWGGSRGPDSPGSPPNPGPGSGCRPALRCRAECRMWGWLRLETALASRSNRSRSSALSERCWGRVATISDTVRENQADLRVN